MPSTSYVATTIFGQSYQVFNTSCNQYCDAK